MRSVVSKLAFPSPFVSVFDMNGLQNIAFGNLLAAWVRRDDARQSRSLPRLADARFELDDARTQMRSTFVSPR